jgi:hypothetical protein
MYFETNDEKSCLSNENAKGEGKLSFFFSSNIILEYIRVFQEISSLQ